MWHGSYAYSQPHLQSETSILSNSVQLQYSPNLTKQQTSDDLPLVRRSEAVIQLTFRVDTDTDHKPTFQNGSHLHLETKMQYIDLYSLYYDTVNKLYWIVRTCTTTCRSHVDVHSSESNKLKFHK